mgnify:CR=1 FL=1
MAEGQGTDFAGDVARYGLGLTYWGRSATQIWITPVIEAVTSIHPILTDPAIDGWRPAPTVIGGVLLEECRRLKAR